MSAHSPTKSAASSCVRSILLIGISPRRPFNLGSGEPRSIARSIVMVFRARRTQRWNSPGDGRLPSLQ
jgi:hypothetical protein